MKFSRFLIGVVLLLLIAFGSFWGYVQLRTYPADTTRLHEIRADSRLILEEISGYYVIRPDRQRADVVMIYYPGGLVDPGAYLYTMGRVALELGIDVYIVRPPFNAAIFRTSAARPIMEKYPDRDAWIGGHSLGGIAACRFAANEPEKVDGLFLLGSYCDRGLNDFGGWVLSVMGNADAIIDRENYREARSNLPERAWIYDVPGLNHSDFGEYGHQRGDGPSQFDSEDLVALLVALFEEVR